MAEQHRQQPKRQLERFVHSCLGRMRHTLRSKMIMKRRKIHRRSSSTAWSSLLARFGNGISSASIAYGDIRNCDRITCYYKNYIQYSTLTLNPSVSAMNEGRVERLDGGGGGIDLVLQRLHRPDWQATAPLTRAAARHPERGGAMIRQRRRGSQAYAGGRRLLMPRRRMRIPYRPSPPPTTSRGA